MKQRDLSFTLLNASSAFDSVMRRLNPLALSDLREELLVHITPLQDVRKFLLTDDQRNPDRGIHQALLRACDFLLAAIRTFADDEDLQAAYIAALRAARKHCRALEVLFTLCQSFPDIDRYFLVEGKEASSLRQGKSRNAQAGLFHIGPHQTLHARGGYSLYIPETHRPQQPAPLIVALHGGYSHGRDFLWAWLAHARSRGYLLLAPSSLAMSWSIGHPDADALQLLKFLEEVRAQFQVDASRILLSGLSDGGTYALHLVLSSGNPFQYAAVTACTLAPFDSRQAAGKHIFWLHGRQDWIFPVTHALQAGKSLKEAGADVRMKVIPDLSHAYPREENGAILDWFESFTDQ